TLIRDSNGDFSGDYKLSGLFAHGGEGLPPGSEVVFRGVQVGRVAATALEGDMARVTVLIDPNFKVPKSATATIQPVNLFGADEVALTTPDHNSDGGPYLAPNGTFAHADNSDELGDLFAAATPLLQKIDTAHLATVLAELSRANQGEGPAIAKSISTGVQLAGLLNSTLNAQELALDSFARFAQAVAPDASSLNAVSNQVNAALPTFNNEEADYQRLINSVIPFANSLTSLLSTYRPDIDTILTAGDNVSRVLLAQQDQLGQVVRGAYDYFHTIATGAASQSVLPDGSTYAYFNTFILFKDVNALVCNLLAPSSPGLSFLGPVQQALAGAGTAFNCSPQMAAFQKAQASSTQTLSSAPTATGSATSSARSTSTQVYGIVGTPDRPKPSGLGAYITTLLGGAS
ncbi:MAG TPA: MCE family protein, partial [Acidimicrobiales bacterium]|nr:MCE family protein [Acidimicrobiales bacterium]